MRKLSALIIAISVAITLLSIYFKGYVSQPLSNVVDEIQITIVPGSSFKEVSQQLSEKGIIKELLPWEVYGRLSGTTNEIKAGEYSLSTNITPLQLLQKLTQGETIQFRTYCN